MNCSTYIFGNFGHGYTQYPYDNIKDVFLHCVSCSHDDKQMIVHREGNLMYYVYVQFFNNRHSLYIGLGIVFNKLMTTDFSSLHHLFEEGVRNLAVEGEILTYRGTEIIPHVKNLSDKGSEARILETYFSSKLSSPFLSTSQLEALNFGISKNTTKWCDLSTNNEKLQEYTQRYDYTILTDVNKNEDKTSDLELMLNMENKKRKVESFFDKIIVKIKELCK